MNRIILVCVLLASTLLLLMPIMAQSLAAESGEFKGTWIANGTRTPFPFGNGRQVYTFKLAGHVNLKTTIAKKKDYWAECIGLADSVAGIIGRCVWKDLAGTEIYLTIQSDQLQQGGQVAGTIVGGSRHLTGISGDLSFNWSSVISTTDEDEIISVTGETKNLAGRYRVP